jgi:hypothetical protein
LPTIIEIKDGKVIAYKSVKKNFASVFKSVIIYKIGETYSAHCDCNSNNDNSFGLSAWTKEKALEYHDQGKLLLVEIDIDDIGCIVQNGSKIRAKKIKILKEVEK